MTSISVMAPDCRTEERECEVVDAKMSSLLAPSRLIEAELEHAAYPGTDMIREKHTFWGILFM